MNNIKISKGDKIKFAFFKENEKPSFSHISTFYKKIDETAILISAPYKNGEILEADENTKILFVHSGVGGEMFFSGYCDDIVKEGIRTYWKIRIVEDDRKFYQRTDERYKVILPIKYTNPLWELDEFGEPEIREGDSSDISAGGVALKNNDNFKIGEIIELDLPSFSNIEGIKKISAVVCWQRELQKEYYKIITGLQFNVTKSEKDAIKLYIESVKRRFKLQ